MISELDIFLVLSYNNLKSCIERSEIFMCTDYVLNLLETLCYANGTSGDESDAAKFSAEKLGEFMDVSIDKLGNVVGRNEEKGIHFLLDAHLDRIGLVVTSITDEGFLKVGACGGIDVRTLDAAEVIVYGTEPVFGVVTAIPPHLTKSNENKASDISDILIDVGMDKETAQKYITPSDRVIVKPQFNKLLSSRVTGTALDDRAGVVSLLLACKILKEKGKLPNLTVVFSVCEETTGSGAKTSSFKASADEAIAVDVSFAMQPGVTAEESGELSKGPMIGFSSTLDFAMSKSLVSIAEKNEIPYQKEVMGSKTGTNADSIAVSGKGVKMGLLSIPQRNMHTQAEIIDVQDVINTAKLIAEYIIYRMEEC